jgi:predicted NBD/HSP70 family sugar kinase
LTKLRPGAGILIGGRLHRGRSGAAGEIGTLRQVGWEDAAMELVAMELAAKELVAMELVAKELGKEGGAAEVFAAAGAGDADATRRHLAELCLSAPEVVASTFGDESVALGGVRLALDHVEREVLGL